MSNLNFCRIKRFLQIAFVLILLVSICLIVTACQCQHEYEETITKQATCYADGEAEYVCSKCGDTYTEVVPMLKEHQLSEVYLSDDGKHWQACALCDYITEKVDHLYSTVVFNKPSTCTEQGTVIKACVCGKTHTDNLPLTNHDYSKSVYDDSDHWVVCSVCNAINTSVGKTPHNLTVNKTDATCELDGKTVTTCSGCEYSQVETTPKLGHDLDKTSFSSASTGSGHYYKCNRCNENVAEAHTLVDCECPDGYNRAATCYKEGHQDRQCSLCEWRNHFTTSRTDDHNFSREWTYNGTYHWNICLNGDGSVECDFKGNEAQHDWKEDRVEPTCTETGSVRKVCECGAVQSGSYKVLPKLGHDYVTVEIIIEATCEHDGKVVQRCSRCQDEREAVVEKLEHDYSLYESTANGHYRKCANCGYTQETIRNHTWNIEVVKEPTCTESGLTVRTCEYCKYVDRQVTNRNHNYLMDDPDRTDPTKFADATCKEYGWRAETCEFCGDHRINVLEYLGYADHNVKEYPAKEMTETEPGNIRYWQCLVCKKYFTSHGCVEELTEDQIFTYPPQIIKPNNITELLEMASDLADEVASDDYYQITATVGDIDTASKALLIYDDADIYASLVDRVNIFTINENDTITLKGKLFKSGNVVTLVDCKVIDIDCGDSNKFSLSITMSGEYGGSDYIYASVDLERGFAPNTENYNCLVKGETLKFEVYMYSQGTVLQKVIINGKAYTVNKGILEITVTEDIFAEFICARTNKCSVNLYKIDTTNNNGNEIIVDEYISYKYINGGYNDDGRLHKNSHLIFTANNANITGINITYDADYLADHSEILNNVINAIKANGVKVKVEQGSVNGKSQVVITLAAGDVYTALEYFASASQARITEIIVLYETYNTCA